MCCCYCCCLWPAVHSPNPWELGRRRRKNREKNRHWKMSKPMDFFKRLSFACELHQNPLALLKWHAASSKSTMKTYNHNLGAKSTKKIYNNLHRTKMDLSWWRIKFYHAFSTNWLHLRPDRTRLLSGVWVRHNAGCAKVKNKLFVSGPEKRAYLKDSRCWCSVKCNPVAAL